MCKKPIPMNGRSQPSIHSIVKIRLVELKKILSANLIKYTIREREYNINNVNYNKIFLNLPYV